MISKQTKCEETFAKRIERLRKAKKWTQSDLISKISVLYRNGWDVDLVNMLESTKCTELSLLLAKPLAEALGVSTHYLTTGEE